MVLQLIGAGLPRTGTSSLREALKYLLDAPVYHMSEAFAHPEHARTWVAAIEGEATDWEDFLAGYAAGVDTPFSNCWRGLASAYPDAPVLLSRRADPERWYRSMAATVLSRAREMFTRNDDPMAPLFKAIFGDLFTDLDDKDAVIAGYQRRLDAVRAEIGPERLVEWQPGDGWEPICRALGVPVPERPFPHENSTADFLARTRIRAQNDERRVASLVGSPSMDMLMGDKIAEAALTDWRKLAQGLHARYLVEDFGSAARFVAAVGEAGDAQGHHPRAAIGQGYVDLELVTDNAVLRDDDGTELVLEWVTQQDVDLARRITEIAADHGIPADPSSVSEIELGLDAASSGTVAPVWAALLTANADDQGRGTPGDEIRDARGRLPNLWFTEPDDEDPARQRWHVEVYVAPEVVEQRVAGAVAAGGTIVDDSEAPGLTVIADQDGNRGVICADTSAARAV